MVKGLIAKGQAARFYRRKIKKGMRVTSVNGKVPIPGDGDHAIELVTAKVRPLTIGASASIHSSIRPSIHPSIHRWRVSSRVV